MMVYFKFIELLTILCIINTTIAFKCWCCSSDESDSAFCGKILEESNLTKYQKAVNLVDCTYPNYEKGRDLITKCMIQRTTNNGEKVYARSCVWEDRNSQNDACKSLSPPYGHRMEACETCLDDKCNYKLMSDSYGGSTHLQATFYHFVFIWLVIVLII